MADDKLSAAVAEVGAAITQAEEAGMGRNLDKVIYTHGLMTGTSRRLLTALEAVLRGHEPVQLYESADNCGHPKPYEPEQEAPDAR